jgi:hypothetical protein
MPLHLEKQKLITGSMTNDGMSVFESSGATNRLTFQRLEAVDCLS